MNTVEKIFKNICACISDKILSSDCNTACWYLSDNFRNFYTKERQKEIINNLVYAIDNKQLNYDKVSNCPVLYLSVPVKTDIGVIDRLYMQNIITLDLIDKYKNETDLEKNDKRYLSFLFACNDNIINKLNKNDFDIASNLLNLLHLV